MGAIKLLIISLIILFLVMLGISALLPSEIRISRAIDIEAPPETVETALRDFSSWKTWNEFVKPVSSLKIAGDSLIAPELTVVLKPGNRQKLNPLWLQPGHATLPAVYAIYSTRGITTLQWYFTCSFRWYPWEKFGSMVYDKQLGTPMDQSLHNLKQMLESGGRIQGQ